LGGKSFGEKSFGEWSFEEKSLGELSYGEWSFGGKVVWGTDIEPIWLNSSVECLDIKLAELLWINYMVFPFK
jgi:hypothetical protein